MLTSRGILAFFFRMCIWLGNLKKTLPAYSPAIETQIKNETVLTHTYDPECRPRAETHVKVGLSVIAIDELDIKGQKLTTAGWLTFEWHDDRIRWNKTEKDNIEYIFVKPDNIWKPELLVDNALEALGVIKSEDLLLRVKSNGQVEWDPPLLFTTHCQVDITYYPYDKQKCAVNILSWSYTKDEVKLDHLFEEVNLEDFELHGEWELIDTELEDKILTEHLPDGTVRVYPLIAFWMHLKRRTDFYNLNVVMPIILTSLMVVMVFLVPVESGEKVSYVLTVFLTLAVLLTIVTESLPPTSITVSVLGLYLGIVLVFSAVAIILTVLILILAHKEGQPKQNSFLTMITRVAAKLICRKIPRRRKLSQEVVVNNISSKAVYVAETQGANGGNTFDDAIVGKDGVDNGVRNFGSSEAACEISWKDMAHILDRFCFFSFTLVTFLMNLAFVVTLATGGLYASSHHSE